MSEKRQALQQEIEKAIESLRSAADALALLTDELCNEVPAVDETPHWVPVDLAKPNSIHELLTYGPQRKNASALDPSGRIYIKNDSGSVVFDGVDFSEAGQDTPTGGPKNNSGGEATAEFYKCNEVVFRNCKFAGRWRPGDGEIYDYGYFGIKLYKVNKVVFERCTISGYFDGVFIDDVMAVQIRHCVIFDNIHSQLFLRRLRGRKAGESIVENNLIYLSEPVFQHGGSSDMVNVFEPHTVAQKDQRVSIKNNVIINGKGNYGSHIIVDGKYNPDYGTWGGAIIGGNVCIDHLNAGIAITTGRGSHVEGNRVFQHIEYVEGEQINPRSGAVSYTAIDHQSGDSPPDPGLVVTCLKTICHRLGTSPVRRSISTRKI